MQQCSSTPVILCASDLLHVIISYRIAGFLLGVLIFAFLRGKAIS